MSIYKLNSTDLSTYGINPGRVSGSNISLSGCFDLPARLGTCYYEWDDEDGVEPFVDADDFRFSGRDLEFSGIMVSDSKKDLILQANKFKAFINSFTGLVLLETRYGSFNVYVNGVTFEMYKNVASLTIKMREPVVDLSGAIPKTGTGVYLIDGIPFQSLGLYTSDVQNRINIPELKKQNYTSYSKEGFQITKRTANGITFSGFVVGTSLPDFVTKIKSLYAVFSSPGLRTLVLLNDNMSRTVFAKDGFKVTNVIINENIVAADFSISLMVVSEVESK